MRNLFYIFFDCVHIAKLYANMRRCGCVIKNIHESRENVWSVIWGKDLINIGGFVVKCRKKADRES